MFKNDDFSVRQANAKASRTQLLEAHRAAALAAAPAQAEVMRERVQLAEARKARHEIRDERRSAEKAHKASQTEKALRAAHEAAVALAAEEAALSLKEAQAAMIKAIVTDHAERKSARDLRYANRKAAARR